MGTVEFPVDDHAAIEMNDRAVFFLLPPSGEFSGLFVILADLPGADHIYILGTYSNALLSLRRRESSYFLKLARMGTGNRSEDKNGKNAQDDKASIHILSPRRQRVL